MAGMAEVGRLFNANELIVAEVLQSAEAMKTAVSYLEQFMEKADSAKRGKVVLATVKGDVHDIGKNLVEIIFKNNGYEVVNLGIKVPPEELIKAYQEHHPDAIGLSGLLVKSAQQMVTTASDLKDAGIEIPLLVGGAALSAKFTQTKIAPSYGKAVCYAKDAMTGLRLMNQLMDPATRESVLREHTASGNGFSVSTTVKVAPIPKVTRSPRVRPDLPIPPVPNLDRKVRLVPDLRDIWSYVNPYMLYGRHLRFRGDFEKHLAEGVRPRSEKAKNEGHYFLSHGLQALAIETAEGCAEWLHRRIREDWGFPDPPEMTMAQRFTSRYRGKRYSSGYPACPNLEDQAGIWKLLKPEEIGVQLTEGFMMDPEASVSALVFHHPDCTYFSVGDAAEA